MRCTIALIIFISLQNVCRTDSDNFRQEAAKVINVNPKYIKDINIFTHRLKRNSPYLTSCNATTIHSWENNVSVVIDASNPKINMELFSLEFKLCDILRVPWAKEWLTTYSNVPLHCPVPAMTFRLTDFEIPPKNFPVPLPPGDYSAKVMFVITKTKEKIVELRMNLRFQKKH